MERAELRKGSGLVCLTKNASVDMDGAEQSKAGRSAPGGALRHRKPATFASGGMARRRDQERLPCPSMALEAPSVCFLSPLPVSIPHTSIRIVDHIHPKRVYIANRAIGRRGLGIRQQQ